LTHTQFTLVVYGSGSHVYIALHSSLVWFTHTPHTLHTHVYTHTQFGLVYRFTLHTYTLRLHTVCTVYGLRCSTVYGLRSHGTFTPAFWFTAPRTRDFAVYTRLHTQVHAHTHWFTHDTAVCTLVPVYRFTHFGLVARLVGFGLVCAFARAHCRCRFTHCTRTLHTHLYTVYAARSHTHTHPPRVCCTTHVYGLRGSTGFGCVLTLPAVGCASHWTTPVGSARLGFALLLCRWLRVSGFGYPLHYTHRDCTAAPRVTRCGLRVAAEHTFYTAYTVAFTLLTAPHLVCRTGYALPRPAHAAHHTHTLHTHTRTALSRTAGCTVYALAHTHAHARLRRFAHTTLHRHAHCRDLHLHYAAAHARFAHTHTHTILLHAGLVWFTLCTPHTHTHTRFTPLVCRAHTFVAVGYYAYRAVARALRAFWLHARFATHTLHHAVYAHAHGCRTHARVCARDTHCGTRTRTHYAPVCICPARFALRLPHAYTRTSAGSLLPGCAPRTLHAPHFAVCTRTGYHAAHALWFVAPHTRVALHAVTRHGHPTHRLVGSAHYPFTHTRVVVYTPHTEVAFYTHGSTVHTFCRFSLTHTFTHYTHTGYSSTHPGTHTIHLHTQLHLHTHTHTRCPHGCPHTVPTPHTV